MHELSIPEKNINWQLPENAAECTPRQYYSLLLLYAKALSDGLTPDVFKARLAYAFLQLKPSRKAAKKQSLSAQPKHSNLWRIAQLFDGFLTQSNGQATINMNSIRQYFPRIQHKGRMYFGTEDALTSLTFIEFIHADVALRSYAATGDVGQLNLLTAIVYKRQTWRTWFGLDEMYNAKKTEAHAKKLQTLPIEYKLAALNLLQSTMQWWADGPIEINGSQVDLRILFKNKSGKTKSSGGLTDVLYSLAESGVFGTAKETSQANLYDVLLRLHQVSQTQKAQSND